MNISLILLITSALAVVISLIVSRLQSEISAPILLMGMMLKVFIRELHPALNDNASLTKVRNMYNGVSSRQVSPNITIRNFSILSPDKMNIPVRLYTAQKSDKNDILRPVLIWFHGGGFVMGNYTNEDTTCTKIVEYTDFIVLNADYRLAPEDKFPAGVNDASAVLRWVKRSIEKYGGDPAQIFVSGESAGGNIAAAITAINYDPVYAGQSDQLQQLEGSIPFEQSERVDIKGLVLFYPCLEHGVYRDSHFRYSETFPLLTLKQMQHFWSLYLNDQHKDSQDYRACPLRTPKKILLQFPKTLIVLAKHDVLLDEGLEFARYLDELEVSVETIVYNNMVHGFFAKRGMSTEDQTIEICKKIKSMVTA